MGAFRADRTVKFVHLELIELGAMVHSEKVIAFRADRTEKVDAFRAKKKTGGGLYGGTYPYCLNMEVPSMNQSFSRQGTETCVSLGLFKAPRNLKIKIAKLGLHA